MSIESRNLEEFRRKFQEEFGINPKGKNLSQLIGATAGKSGYFTAGLPVEGFNGHVHFDPAQDDYIRVNIGCGFNITDNVKNPAFVRKHLSAVGVSRNTIEGLLELARFRGSREEMEAKVRTFNSKHPRGVLTPEQGVAIFANMESHFRKVAEKNSPGFAYMNEYQKEVLTYHAYKHKTDALSATRYRIAADFAKKVSRGEMDSELGAQKMAKYHSSYYGGKEDLNAKAVLPAVTAASASDSIEERARPALIAWSKKAGKNQTRLMYKAREESMRAPQFAAHNPNRPVEFEVMEDLIAAKMDKTQVVEVPTNPSVASGVVLAGMSLKGRIGAFLAKSRGHMGVATSLSTEEHGPFDAVYEGPYPRTTVGGPGPFDAVKEPSTETPARKKKKRGMGIV